MRPDRRVAGLTAGAISGAMPLRAAALARGDLAALGGGAVATFALVAIVSKRGLSLDVLALVGAVVFVTLVAGFLARPWAMVAIAIPWFALTPMLNVFVNPLVGATKDAIAFAAIIASAIAFVRRRAARRPVVADRVVVVLCGLLMLLYLANIGGALSGETGYGAPWYQGIRLFCEPLFLLLAGMLLRSPRRTLDAAVRSLVVTTVVVALVGIVQQGLGVNELLRLGYTYADQVRQIGPHLRSFGTLDEPFAYSSTLLLGVGVLFAATPRHPAARRFALVVLTIGIFVSYVRSAAVIGLALIALALARRGRSAAAVLLLAASVASASAALVASAQQTPTRSVPVSTDTYLTLNGRTTLWRQQLGHHPSDWLFGRGVGATGTAADRAKKSLAGKQQIGVKSSQSVVDSGYLALWADVGLAGVLVFLALFGRLAVLARRATRRGVNTGWTVQMLIVVVLLDAGSRESFTAFPTAHIAMLLLGLATGALLQDDRTASAARVRSAA